MGHSDKFLPSSLPTSLAQVGTGEQAASSGDGGSQRASGEEGKGGSLSSSQAQSHHEGKGTTDESYKFLSFKVESKL